ncbi:MAG TPA: Rrf2 family transcriptional regulator [Bryobacteraceae bacterium]|nr:Rrf2 family transcriptional regulator [Bryobacteraceae bacterium]
MFSQTVEYALRAMVVLANHPQSPQTAHSIASVSQVPVDYLFKVLQSLNRSDLVAAQRGKHGGFTLARNASEVTILQIINAVDPIRRIRFCPLGIKSHGTHLCALHRKLDAALQSIEHTFGTTTLAEMLQEPAPYQPLCEGLVQVHA